MTQEQEQKAVELLKDAMVMFLNIRVNHDRGLQYSQYEATGKQIKKFLAELK